MPRRTEVMLVAPEGSHTNRSVGRHRSEECEHQAKNNPEDSEAKKTGGTWEQLIPVLQSIRDHKVTLVPGKLFELHQQWQGPASDFEQSLLSRLRTERKLHAQAYAAGGFDDFWACESCFIDARTKDIRK